MPVRFTEFNHDEDSCFKDIIFKIEQSSFNKNIFCFFNDRINIFYFYLENDPIEKNISRRNIKYEFNFEDNESKNTFYAIINSHFKNFYGLVTTSNLEFSVSLTASAFYNGLFKEYNIENNVRIQKNFFSNLNYERKDFIETFKNKVHLLSLIDENNYLRYSTISHSISLKNYENLLEYAYYLNKDVFDLSIEEQELFFLNKDVKLNLEIDNNQKSLKKFISSFLNKLAF